MPVRRRWTPRHHFVTHAGLCLLAAIEGVPPLRYAEHAGLAVETSATGRGGNRLRNLRRNFEHTLGTNAVFSRLCRDAARAGHPLPFWWSESEAAEHFEHYDRRYWIRPDGAGIYYLGEEQKYFLLEYDRGTMRPRDYRRKLAGIAAYFVSGLADKTYDEDVTVLVVSETDDGERRFAEAVAEAEEHWAIELPVLLATRERINREWRGLLGPVWRTSDDPQRRVWLDGIEVPFRCASTAGDRRATDGGGRALLGPCRSTRPGRRGRAPRRGTNSGGGLLAAVFEDDEEPGEGTERSTDDGDLEAG